MGVDGLTAGAVARRLGIAVTTLRTWHQRYGLGPSHHVPGRHRRYTSEDMGRLQVMRRLTAQGVAPAEAAAWARRVPVSIEASGPVLLEAPPEGGDSPPGTEDAGHRPASSANQAQVAPDDATSASSQGGGGPGDAHPMSPAPDDIGPSPTATSRTGPIPTHTSGTDPTPIRASDTSPTRPGASDADAARARTNDADPARTGDPRSTRLPTIDVAWPEQTGLRFVARDGGGLALHAGRAGPAARGFARAAMRLDGPAVRDILEIAVTDRGVVAAWQEVIMPVLVGIGERYAATNRFIEVEHLISRGVTEVLSSVTRPPSTLLPRVLLAAADEEQHTLPLEALAAALAQAGVPSRFLGARLPPQALGDAVTRTGPAAVVIWSQMSSTGDPGQWVHLLAGPHRPVLAAAAGPGWPVAKLPENVTVLGSLPEAVRLVSMAALPAGRAN